MELWLRHTASRRGPVKRERVGVPTNALLVAPMSSGPQPANPPPPDADGLRCEIVRDGDLGRVAVRGALDLATVPILEAELAALRQAGFRRVILDLGELGFMDSTGLRCILERDAEARQDGFSFALIAGPPAVQRVFEVTGMATRLTFVDA
jgi:anti-anti-sigma factor